MPRGLGRAGPPRAVALFAIGVVGVLFGQWWLTDGAPAAALVVWTVGLTVAVVAQWSVPSPAPPVPASPDDPARWTWHTRVAVVAVALQCSAVVLIAAGLDARSDHTTMALAWVAAMVTLVVAAAMATASRRQARRRRWLDGWADWEVWAFVGVVVTACLTRFVRLGRFPLTIDGDGAAFALIARRVREGTLRDPFTVQYYGMGTLFAWVQATGTRLFGDTVAGVTSVTAAMGVASVVFTYLLARRLLGPSGGLVAGVVLAVFHAHVFLSRVPLNNVADMLACPAVLYFVDRAVVERRRVDAALGGIVLGLSLYFYPGARILLVLATVAGVVLATDERRRASWRASVGLAGWYVAGVVVAFLPLALHYLGVPSDLNARVNQVSVFGDWLGTERARTGDGTAVVLMRQLRDAVLLPFSTPPTGTYKVGPPLLGWPVAIPAAIGVAVATASPLRRRHAALVIVWWGSLLGVATTVGLPSQRWAVALPMVAIAVAVGVEATWRVVTRAWPGPRATRRAVLALGVGVAGLAWWNVAFTFGDDAVLDRYSDVNTLVATELGRELEHDAPGTVVHVAFAPRMSYRSHNSIELVAPQVVGDDLVEPLGDVADVPPVTGPTVFAFLPERRSELAVVRRAHPGGRVHDVTWHGVALYTTYRVG